MNVNEILQDPEFQGMNIEERRKVIFKVDPEFGKLQTPEQDRVLNWYVTKQPAQSGLLQQMGQSVLRTGQNIGTAWGPAEALIGMATQAYGVPASGLAQLSGLPFGKSQQWGEAVQRATVYQPQTQAGQELTEAATYPFQKLGQVAESATDITREITGSPIIATAIGTGIQASPMLMGIRGKGPVKPQIRPITKGTVLERVAEVIPPGSEFFKRHRAKLNDMVNKSNQQFTTEVLNLPHPSLGRIAKEQSAKLFKEMNDAIGQNELVNAPNLVKWADENYGAARLTNKTVANVVQQIHKDIASEGTTKFYNINNLQYWMSKKFKPAPAEMQIYAGIKEAIKADLDLIGQSKGKPILEMYEQAMDAARLGHRVTETKYVEALIKKATRYDPDRQVQIFDPVRFRQSVTDNMPRFQQMFRKNPEIPQLIDGYANKMMEVSRDLAKFSSQKSLGPQGWLQTLGAAGVVGSLKTGLIIPWGFETAMAYSLAHPRGWLKRYVGSKTVGPIGPVLGAMVEQE